MDNEHTLLWIVAVVAVVGVVSMFVGSRPGSLAQGGLPDATLGGQTTYYPEFCQIAACYGMYGSSVVCYYQSGSHGLVAHYSYSKFMCVPSSLDPGVHAR